MSVDSFVGGPNGELDWMTWNWDDKLKTFVDDLHTSVDTILLGKNMTDGFVTHWAKVKENPKDEEQSFGALMTDTPKFVFSRTLDKSNWQNTTLAKGDYVEFINKLKNQSGKDIIVYGGATFVSSLVKANLIDEYNLFINPTVIGNGISIFNQVDGKLNLNLFESISYNCGVVVNRYKPGK